MRDGGSFEAKAFSTAGVKSQRPLGNGLKKSGGPVLQIFGVAKTAPTSLFQAFGQVPTVATKSVLTTSRLVRWYNKWNLLIFLCICTICLLIVLSVYRIATRQTERERRWFGKVVRTPHNLVSQAWYWNKTDRLLVSQGRHSTCWMRGDGPEKLQLKAEAVSKNWIFHFANFVSQFPTLCFSVHVRYI